jgi:hypothetical protein
MKIAAITAMTITAEWRRVSEADHGPPRSQVILDGLGTPATEGGGRAGRGGARALVARGAARQRPVALKLRPLKRPLQ